MRRKTLLTRETLASFYVPGYFWLWLSISTNGFANVVSQIAIGWLALELTGSPFGVGVAVASRALPRIVLSIPFGVLSDKKDRRTILQITNAFGAVVTAVMAVLCMAGLLNFSLIIVIAVFIGLFDVAETSVSRALVYDLVGEKQALNGISLVSLADKLFGVLGALSAGILLAQLGSSGAFWGIAIAYLLSALSLMGVTRALKKHTLPEPEKMESSQQKKPERRNLAFILKNPGLLVLAATAVIMEVFAFSSDVLLPSFARDILKVGETGLGAMTAVRSVGGVIGVLILAAISTRIKQIRLLIGAGIGFGLGLILFAGSPTFAVALILLLLIGAMWASVDSLLPTLVQFSVPDSQRGAAVGVWNLSRGMGPLGHLEIGAAASALGAAAALTINGFIVIGMIMVIAVISRARKSLFQHD